MWREQAWGRLAILRDELKRLPGSSESDEQATEARRWLEEAFDIVDRRPTLWSGLSGVDVVGAWVRIHAIEVALIRLSELKSVKAKLPGIVVAGSQLLSKEDPHLAALRDYADKEALNEEDREFIAECVSAVYDAADSQTRRLRSYRNMLLGTAIGLALFAILFGALCAAMPSAMYLSPTKSMSAAGLSELPGLTQKDIFVTELLGLFSASLIGSVAIRQMRGTSTPYGVPMASLLLKLPTGALTAVAGLLLMRAGIGGVDLAAADGPHLAAYALGFGASQQTFTRFIDRQTQNVLNTIPAKDRDAAKDGA